ncbi:vanadium-dependent haloperoxidase [Neobacillus sp. KR4-4]|uniref:vanadium-dependent haloperoxidase n=1 Tax=Neobacillus sp. KR4-4 TaxID=3344872 RepID=UPI0035CBCCD8
MDKHKFKKVIKKMSRYINSCLLGPLSPAERRDKAFEIRMEAAKFYKNQPLVNHRNNGDEDRYPNKIASYSKALPHNELGEVNLKAYHNYLEALKSGDSKDFEKIPMGGAAKLVNPQSAYAYDLVGPDSHQLVLHAPPDFSSADLAGEMVELYWQALARDIPFNEYDSNQLTKDAAAELSGLPVFNGPKINGQVTTGTLFRGNYQGSIEGPYISQFLWKNIPFVSTEIIQQYNTILPGDDHLTSYSEWLAVQNGSNPHNKKMDSVPRYIRNGRDLAEWVHNDSSIDSGLMACYLLLSYGSKALDQENPYFNSATQVGFPTFGVPHILDFITRASRPALDAVWFQKWLVHRRLRPEEFGGRIHNKMMGADYPINPVVMSSEALIQTFNKFGTYLLPQAYSEGCPTHPSYPSGHAAFIGAMVTMMKAFFDESYEIPDPVVASSDGLHLLPYDGKLTLGGELNKLAANIAIGRTIAGVHYRSSAINGMLLGEAVAIGILRDYKRTYNESFKGFSLTKFDGSKITT